MCNHNKAQQSKNRVHISWDILYYQIIVVDGYPANEINGLVLYSSIPSASLIKILLCCFKPQHFEVCLLYEQTSSFSYGIF